MPRDEYRVGAPAPGRYRTRFSSDDRAFGGSEVEIHAVIETEPTPFHGQAQSMRLRLPPLGLLVLAPER